MSKAIEQYCRNVEGLFLTEMFPRPNDYIQPQKSSAWLEKARQLAITGEKKVEPFNFQPESCVKLNNVEAARKLLDNMYNQMQADKITEVLKRSPPVPSKTEQERFLFSVKIVIAEGLVPLDSNPSSKLDTFITLSNEEGVRLAKTRTIYETLNPRCEWLVLSFVLSGEAAGTLKLKLRRGRDVRYLCRQGAVADGQRARSGAGGQARHGRARVLVPGPETVWGLPGA
jgi:hypothetical protein